MVAVEHAVGRGSVCVDWWAAELEDGWSEDPYESNAYQGEGDPAEQGAAGESAKLGGLGKGERMPDMRWQHGKRRQRNVGGS